jgi:hypothetical protein
MHDVSSMTRYAYERILLIVDASEDDEWEGQARYLPLR